MIHSYRILIPSVHPSPLSHLISLTHDQRPSEEVVWQTHTAHRYGGAITFNYISLVQ